MTSCIVSDVYFAPDGSGPVAGAVIQVFQTEYPMWAQEGSNWPLLQNAVKNLTTDANGAWSITLPQAASTDPATGGYLFQFPDGNAIAGSVPPIAGPIGLKALKDTWSWGIVASGGPVSTVGMSYATATTPGSVEVAVSPSVGTAATALVTTQLGAVNGVADLDSGGHVPNARLANLTDTNIAAANKDGVAGTASLRTLGPGAQQALPGNDPSTTNTRIPTDGSVTDAKVASGIDPAKIAGTAVVTADPRLSDTRTPTDGSVTTPKLASLAVTDAKVNDVAAGKVTGAFAKAQQHAQTAYLDATETFTAAQTGPFLDKGGQSFSAKAYGAVGDGTTSDFTALTNAKNAATASGGTLDLGSVGTFLLDSNLTIPANVTLASRGAQIKVATGVTLTISGSIVAPIRQLFTNVTGALGTGGVVSIDPTYVAEVWLEWFGAKGDCTAKTTGTGTDNLIPITAAILSLAGFSQGTIRGSGRYYRTTSTINILSSGSAVTNIKFLGPGARYGGEGAAACSLLLDAPSAKTNGAVLPLSSTIAVTGAQGPRSFQAGDTVVLSDRLWEQLPVASFASNTLTLTSSTIATYTNATHITVQTGEGTKFLKGGTIQVSGTFTDTAVIASIAGDVLTLTSPGLAHSHVGTDPVQTVTQALPATTVLTNPAANQITVSAAAGLLIKKGDIVQVGSGGTIDTGTVLWSYAGTITFTGNLPNSHSPGEAVQTVHGNGIGVGLNIPLLALYSRECIVDGWGFYPVANGFCFVGVDAAKASGGQTSTEEQISHCSFGKSPLGTGFQTIGIAVDRPADPNNEFFLIQDCKLRQQDYAGFYLTGNNNSLNHHLVRCLFSSSPYAIAMTTGSLHTDSCSFSSHLVAGVLATGFNHHQTHLNVDSENTPQMFDITSGSSPPPTFQLLGGRVAPYTIGGFVPATPGAGEEWIHTNNANPTLIGLFCDSGADPNVLIRTDSGSLLAIGCTFANQNPAVGGGSTGPSSSRTYLSCVGRAVAGVTGELAASSITGPNLLMQGSRNFLPTAVLGLPLVLANPESNNSTGNPFQNVAGQSRMLQDNQWRNQVVFAEATGSAVVPPFCGIAQSALAKPLWPSVTVSTASGTLPAGAYSFGVDFVTPAGTTNTPTTNYTAAAIGAGLTGTITIAGIATGPAGTTARRIWRFPPGGGSDFHDIADNTTTTLVDAGAVVWTSGSRPGSDTSGIASGKIAGLGGTTGVKMVTATTASAGAIASPGNFAGFLDIEINGVIVKLPYFNT